MTAEAPAPVLSLDADASTEEIAALRERLAHLFSERAESCAGAPFLLATPLGLARREALEDAIAAAGVEIVKRTPIPFPDVATALYVKRPDDEEELHRALAFEQLWRARPGGCAAEVWSLASTAAFARLVQAKRAVRAAVPSWPARVTTPGRAWDARLHAFHVPDPGHAEREASIVERFLSTGARPADRPASWAGRSR